MLNLGDDSSEEDEDVNEILQSIPNINALDSNRAQERSLIADVPQMQEESNTMSSLSSILFQNDDEDDDEEDAPLPPEMVIDDSSKAPEIESKPAVLIASQDFTDALHAISVDPWDTSSWVTYLIEVEQSRGGSVMVDEAYEKFLILYPKAFNFWKSYGEYYAKRRDVTTAENIFKRCLVDCRNVELWMSYLEMTKKNTVDKVTRGNDQEYMQERQKYEAAIKRAVESVGMAPDSSVLWRL